MAHKKMCRKCGALKDCEALTRDKRAHETEKVVTTA